MKRTGLKNRLIAGALATMTLASVGTMSVTASAKEISNEETAPALSGAIVIDSNSSVQNPFTEDNNNDNALLMLCSNNITNKPAAVANSKSADEINSFINSLTVNKLINSKDNYDYKTRIGANGNDDKSKLYESELQNSTFFTKTEKHNDGAFFKKQKNTSELAGIGAASNLEYIYPGNILMMEESNGKMNVAEGKYTKFDLKNRGASTLIVNNDYDKEFVVNDISNEKEVQKGLYNFLKDKGSFSNYYVIRIASATSPEQLSASLNMSESAINSKISEGQWKDVRSGKKQISAVSVQQVVASVEMTNDLTNPADLFNSDATVQDIKKISKDGKKTDGMLVTKVNYGREYLMTTELNLRNTPKEQHVDLTSALIKLFRSHSNFTASERNATKYANVKTYEIGYSSNQWKECKDIRSTTEFIKHLSRQKEYKSGNQNLVPVSYEAVSLGGSLPMMRMNTVASEYDFYGVGSQKITGIKFRDDGDGKSKAREYIGYGIDLDKYNETGEIVEKAYKVISGDVDNASIPAYKCIFGVTFNLSGGEKNGNCYMNTGTRIYNNAGFTTKEEDGKESKEMILNLSYMNLTINMEEHYSIGYNRNGYHLYYSFISAEKDTKGDYKYYNHIIQPGGNNFTGWNKVGTTFFYDNTYDVNGNGLFLNNKSVDNT